MYGKIFKQIYKGTLAMVGPWEALVTFQQMIILADKDGVVDMTADAISRETTIPLKVINKGIEALEAPDPESRSPNEGGRRIVLLSDSRSWGWRIVNYDHYRKLRSEEERREYHRQYWHKRKEKPGELKKINARRQANSAITSGKLVQGPCEVCGTEFGIEAHHDDYDKPLDVRWLCKEHHTEHHLSTAPQHASTDTTNSSKQKVVCSKDKTYRATKRAPSDYSPSEPMLDELTAETNLGTPDLMALLREMKDHEFKAAKKDWDAVYRNWVRRSANWRKDETRKRSEDFGTIHERNRKAAGLDD